MTGLCAQVVERADCLLEDWLFLKFDNIDFELIFEQIILILSFIKSNNICFKKKNGEDAAEFGHNITTCKRSLASKFTNH